MPAAESNSGPGLASDLARRVCEGSPLIAAVVFAYEHDELIANVHLDPVLVHARAGQQGLPDRSVAGAAVDPRVQRLVADAAAQASADLPAHERIVRCTIVA